MRSIVLRLVLAFVAGVFFLTLWNLFGDLYVFDAPPRSLATYLLSAAMTCVVVTVFFCCSAAKRDKKLWRLI